MTCTTAPVPPACGSPAEVADVELLDGLTAGVGRARRRQCGPLVLACRTALSMPSVHGLPWPGRTSAAPVSARTPKDSSANSLSAVAAPAMIWGPSAARVRIQRDQRVTGEQHATVRQMERAVAIRMPGSEQNARRARVLVRIPVRVSGDVEVLAVQPDRDAQVLLQLTCHPDVVEVRMCEGDSSNISWAIVQAPDRRAGLPAIQLAARRRR